MPRVREEPVKVFAHCGDPLCPGHVQERLEGVRVETEVTYAEKGGDAPGVENSFVHFRLVNPEEQACPGCGKAREITDNQRKVYQPLSGHDPNGLLKHGPFDPNKQASSEVEALRAELEELRALVREQATA